FGGDRSAEFEAKIAGESYEAIARGGGGILSTVAATRAAPDSELFEGSARRLNRLMAEGVTTVEIKSGYGLETEAELKMLRVARDLGRRFPVTVRTTFLGAHTVPGEYRGRAEAYIDLVIGEMLPAVAADNLADAVDAFLESIAFSAGQVRLVLAAAQGLGLPVKLHADQLSDSGGAALAAELGALSADHLEYASAGGIRAMGEAGTVAVLLPGAYHMVGADRPPPIQSFREAGVPIAIATDCNPGSSPLVSPLLAMHFACTLFRLTPEEALMGMTAHGARALGLKDRGTLAVGQRADLAIWDISHPRELAYWMGASPLAGRIVAGRAA
ncbi:MAG TPA: imidazolonepropionase, partial [Alphaproteobacteria bacterium]|nr:imidazolonepropionase [Alphaproteobacteria bacterium]